MVEKQKEGKMLRLVASWLKESQVIQDWVSNRDNPYKDIDKRLTEGPDKYDTRNLRPESPQLALPGIEPGLPERDLTGVESRYSNIDLHKNKERLNLEESEGWGKIRDYYSESERKRWKQRGFGDEESWRWGGEREKVEEKRKHWGYGLDLENGLKFPSPSAFPSMTEDQFYSLFNVPAALLNEVWKNYEAFRESYESLYSILVEASEDRRRIGDPIDHLKKMLDEPIAEALYELGNLLEMGFRHGISHSIIQKSSFVYLTYTINNLMGPRTERGKKHIDNGYLLEAIEEITKVENIWYNSRDMYERVRGVWSAGIERILSDKNNLLVLQGAEETNPTLRKKLFKRMAKFVGLIDSGDFNELIHELSKTLKSIEEIIGEQLSSLYISLSGELIDHESVKIYQKTFYEEYKERASKIISVAQKFKSGIKEIAESDIVRNQRILRGIAPGQKRFIERAYEELKEVLNPYSNLEAFDRVFSQMLTLRISEKLTEVEKLGYKYELLKSIMYMSSSCNAFISESLAREIYLLFKNRGEEGVEELARREAEARFAKEISNRVFNIPVDASAVNTNALMDVIKIGNGRFLGRHELAQKFISENIPDVNRKLAKTFLNKLSYPELVQAFNNLTIISSIKIVDKLGITGPRGIEKIDEVIQGFRNHIDIKTLSESFPDSFKNWKDSAEFLIGAIRNKDTWERDVKVAEKLVMMAHNNADGIGKDEMYALLDNPNAQFLVRRWDWSEDFTKKDEQLFEELYHGSDYEEASHVWRDGIDAVKKFFEVALKVIGAGGLKTIMSELRDTVNFLTEKGQIEPGFDDRIEWLMDMFKKRVIINPSKSNFVEIRDMIDQISNEMEMISNFKEFKQYYNQAERKLEEVFDLDLEVSDNIRFRVLKDLDPQHFRVGRETGCCQSPGGVGQAAMVDSFINSHAGVLVLEYKDPYRGWYTAAQSYFHYVPPNEKRKDLKGKGYILDNVEALPENRELDGISIDELYAYLALNKKEELGLDFFESGLGYSKVNSRKFGGNIAAEDPRKFSANETYTDWDHGNYNIDLLDPNFNFKYLPDPREEGEGAKEKVAALSWQFLMMTRMS